MKKFDPDKRLDCRVNISLYVPVNMIIYDDKMLSLPKPIQIEIANISCSGVLIRTSLDFPKNACFCLKFELKKSNIDVVIEIVRKEYDGERFLYGCKFLQPAPPEQQKLRQFVFEEQLKIRKRQRRE